MAVLIPDKAEFKRKNITRDKEGPFIMKKKKPELSNCTWAQ